MIVGLTGGIASGKSTVSRMLLALGAVIIDADLIAREVVAPGQPTLEAIRDSFGQNIILEDGSLDRQKLGAVIFNDGQARTKLNLIIHPAIRKRMTELKEEAIVKGEELIVLDIPLLFESELHYMVEKILVVYVPEHIQKKRLMSRDQIAENEAMSRIRSQMSIEQKKNKGHAFIDNSGSYEETQEQLALIIKQWKREKS
jgi:dephospho-CoA kinase